MAVEDIPTRIQMLWEQYCALYDPANVAFNEVINTPCQSLADVIAKLDWVRVEGDGFLDIVIDDLRRIAGGAA